MAVEQAQFCSAGKMDEIYRYQRHVYDLTRKYFLLGRDEMIAGLSPQPDQTVLEIGCGTGRNLIEVARRYPFARLYGFDVSHAMLEVTRRKLKRLRLENRVCVSLGDATGFDASSLFGVAGFDRIYIAYTLSMIPRWQDALNCALDALLPGGELHIVDFGRQERLPGWFKTALFAWLARFSVEPSADLVPTLDDIAQRNDCAFDAISLRRDYACLAVLRRPDVQSAVASPRAQSSFTAVMKSA